jgi:hypothetical protein
VLTPKESNAMIIEITRPDTEALIHQCLESGEFQDMDELLTKALGALREKEPDAIKEARPCHRGSLVEVCAMVRGLTEDVDFSRNPATDRPVDLA